jgi:hypothetical protein
MISDVIEFLILSGIILVATIASAGAIHLLYKIVLITDNKRKGK